MSVMLQNIAPSGSSSLYRNDFLFLMDANLITASLINGGNINANLPDQSGNEYSIKFDTTIWRGYDGISVSPPFNYFEGRKTGGGSIAYLEPTPSGEFVGPLLQTNPTIFSINVWSRSGGSEAGKICGFQSGVDNTYFGPALVAGYDRHIYVDENGNIIFGCQNNLSKLIISGGYVNDNLWKNICATYENGIMSLYINGLLINSRSDAGVGNYTGVWRLFSYALGGWPGVSASQAFNGDIAFASVYNVCLNSGQINQNFLSLRSRFGV